MNYGMTPISVGTVLVKPNKWIALAFDAEDEKLIACTSSTTSPENAEQTVKNVLRRLNRLNELNTDLISSKVMQNGRRLGELSEGQGNSFEFDEISRQNWSSARIAISKNLLQIPRGKVISYGELAKLAGSSPRGVGSVMASNPVPWAIPCHRVIHSNGKLGKLGRSEEGTKEKERILRAEGVTFRADKTVDSTAFFHLG